MLLGTTPDIFGKDRHLQPCEINANDKAKCTDSLILRLIIQIQLPLLIQIFCFAFVNYLGVHENHLGFVKRSREASNGDSSEQLSGLATPSGRLELEHIKLNMK